MWSSKKFEWKVHFIFSKLSSTTPLTTTLWNIIQQLFHVLCFISLKHIDSSPWICLSKLGDVIYFIGCVGRELCCFTWYSAKTLKKVTFSMMSCHFSSPFNSPIHSSCWDFLRSGKKAEKEDYAKKYIHIYIYIHYIHLE